MKQTSCDTEIHWQSGNITDTGWQIIIMRPCLICPFRDEATYTIQICRGEIDDGISALCVQKTCAFYGIHIMLCNTYQIILCNKYQPGVQTKQVIGWLNDRLILVNIMYSVTCMLQFLSNDNKRMVLINVSFDETRKRGITIHHKHKWNLRDCRKDLGCISCEGIVLPVCTVCLSTGSNCHHFQQ